MEDEKDWISAYFQSSYQVNTVLVSKIKVKPHAWNVFFPFLELLLT